MFLGGYWGCESINTGVTCVNLFVHDPSWVTLVTIYFQLMGGPRMGNSPTFFACVSTGFVLYVVFRVFSVLHDVLVPSL